MISGVTLCISRLITLKSQKLSEMIEATTVVIVIVLSVATFVVAVLYGKRLHEAHRRYSEAKSAFDDVILSFSKQLQRQGEKAEFSARKVEVLSSRGELLAEQMKDQERAVQALAAKVEPLVALDKALPRIDTLENKFGEISSMKESLLQKIAEIEKRRPQRVPEARIESAIPIKREKALAPLTDTELTVLEFLATEGEKTAPQIREQIKLSREHTARLMKKLYEKGYLERGANKIPFTYRLKEEMKNILKKPEQKS